MAKRIYEATFEGSKYKFFGYDIRLDPSTGVIKTIGRDEAGNLVGLILDQNYEITEVTE